MYIQEPTDYVYFRRHEAFANRYIDAFIGKCIEDQFIPDLLLEIIGELDREVKIFDLQKENISFFFSKNKKQGERSIKPEVDRYVTELNNLISQKEINNTQ